MELCSLFAGWYLFIGGLKHRLDYKQSIVQSNDLVYIKQISINSTISVKKILAIFLCKKFAYI